MATVPAIAGIDPKSAWLISILEISAFWQFKWPDNPMA
jgi:hypothetical protein